MVAPLPRKRPHYLEGQGDLVGRFIRGITRVLYRLQGLLTYLLSPPDPPSRGID